jgi:hypothetical protein
MKKMLSLSFLLLASINLYSQPKSKGSLAGKYVAQSGGANTQSYIFIYSNGSYTFRYEEFMDGVKSVHNLSNVQVDESKSTISFTDGKENEKGVVKVEDGETKLELESGPPTYTKINQTEAKTKVETVKPTQKLKGTLMGFYAGKDGSYNINFGNGTYSALFNPQNGDAIPLTNLVIDEIKKTISFNKPNNPKAQKGILTKEGLKIDGEVYADNTSAD